MTGKELIRIDDVGQQASDRILVIRGRQVLLDQDLAEFYGVETRALLQQRRRNEKRFPEDFAFQLSDAEMSDLRLNLRSQNVIANSDADKRLSMRRSRPWVFTEHGAIALAGVLKSKRADEVSVWVSRAFVVMREHMGALTQADREALQLALRAISKLEESDRKLEDSDRMRAKELSEIRSMLESVAEDQVRDRLDRGLPPGSDAP